MSKFCKYCKIEHPLTDEFWKTINHIKDNFVEKACKKRASDWFQKNKFRIYEKNVQRKEEIRLKRQINYKKKSFEKLLQDPEKKRIFDLKIEAEAKLEKYCRFCDISHSLITEFWYIDKKGQYHCKQRRMQLTRSYKQHKQEYDRIYRQKNKEKLRKQFGIIKKKRKLIDPAYKIKENLRNRIYCAIRGFSKSAPTLELIGTTVENLMKYLELQFKDNMSWQNYGKWHIDHIKPCASFDLSDPEQQKLCFHYTNLQPLWAIDNIKKSDKIL